MPDAPPVQLSNQFLTVLFHAASANFEVTDLRAKRTWSQYAARADLLVTSLAVRGSAIDLGLFRVVDDLSLRATVQLEPDAPELSVSINADGPLLRTLDWPPPFVSPASSRLIVPMNEGIGYPASDTSIDPTRLVCYGGHGICMPFWGVDDGGPAAMTLIETPDDASLRISRRNGLLVAGPEWEAQKGRFGYERRLRQMFLSEGGHVALCKRYRAYAQQTGLFRTLEEKRRANPNVDRLIGAANVWCWDRNATGIVSELQSAGIQRILWSAGGDAATVRALNEIPDVLTSRYDIYQDLMDPFILSNQLRGTYNYGWTQEAWPDDINRLANGDWRKGWGIDAKDGTRYYCAVTCDRQAPKYARERVPAELAVKPYRCRFIDTTTAAPWFECYDPRHPLTRTDSREFKMQLLSYMSHDMKLVTGSETGHDAAVPFVHYFEGMLSLGPYRIPDAGREMARIWTNVPDVIAKFQVGERYRLPLWELVYHDCVVAHWYWGDYNNKLPAVWDKRDLFNLLYGTAPMYMFSRELWHQHRDRFVRSYRLIEPVARGAGYAEMTDHRLLAPDGSVQQTRFANGMTVTVNFSAAEFAGPPRVPPMSGFVQ